MGTITEEIKKKVTIPDYFNKVIVPSLTSYYNTKYIDFDAVSMVKCPLHEEDTGSFRYFEETASFYCFGCQCGGDLFTLHKQFMAVNEVEVSFREILAYLNSEFELGLNLIGEVVQIEAKPELEKMKLCQDLNEIKSLLRTFGDFKLYYTVLSLVDLELVSQKDINEFLHKLKNRGVD